MSTELALLAVIAAAASILGTIVGAGGGFLLVPALLFLFPRDPPAALVSMSLVAVFFSGLSGSLAFARQRRIDLRAALLFALAGLPGAVLGALGTRLLPRAGFSAAFGVVLMLVAAYLVLRPRLAVAGGGWREGWTVRRLVDRRGDTYMYSFSARGGMVWSFLIGVVANLFGIGGGIVQVPVLLRLHFPVYVATATSTAVLTATSFTGVMVHMANGEYLTGYPRVLLVAAAVVAGAQVGARLSERLRTALVLRLMSVALVAVGVRLLVAGVAGR